MVEAPSNAELERAIASVPGVAEVSVGASPDTGRSRVRLRLASGADRAAVTSAVIATLRERFGIRLDPATIRPAPAELAAAPAPPRRIDDGPAPPPPAGSPLAEARERLGTAARQAFGDAVDRDLEGASRRVVIRDLDLRRHPDRVEVTARLALGGAVAEGHATGVATPRGGLKAVAEATMRAARTLSGDRLLATVDHVAHVTSPAPPTVQVTVTRRSASGDETLVGAATVHGDLEHAVMRATLDAFNRRLELLLEPDAR